MQDIMEVVMVMVLVDGVFVKIVRCQSLLQHTLLELQQKINFSFFGIVMKVKDEEGNNVVVLLPTKRGMEDVDCVMHKQLDKEYVIVK